MRNPLFLLPLLLLSGAAGQTTDSSDVEATATSTLVSNNEDQKTTEATVGSTKGPETDPLKAKESQSQTTLLVDKDAEDSTQKDQTTQKEPDDGQETSTSSYLKSEAKLIEELMEDSEKVFEELDKKATTLSDNNTVEEYDNNQDSDEADEDIDEDGKNIDVAEDEVIDEDNDSDEDSDNSDGDDLVKLSTVPVESIISEKPEEISVNRQGDINPAFEEIIADGEEQTNNGNGETSGPIYESPRDQDVDNAPLLLTQGGYQRSYPNRMRLNRQRQRTRADGMQQQSETLQSPTRSIDGSAVPQGIRQGTYTDPFQQQFGAAPILPHPFLPPPAFMDNNGILANPPPQNSYFNGPQTAFPDFAPPNFQPQFVSTDVNSFTSLSRSPPGAMSIFHSQPNNVLPNSGFVLQNPFQIPQAPIRHPSRSAGFPFFNFPSPSNVGEANRMNAYGRPSPPNSPVQMSPSPYGPRATVPGNVANNLFNPMASFSNSRIEAPFLPQYPVRYPPPSVQEPSQVPGKQVEVQIIDDDVTSIENRDKEPEINASPNKEDPASIPFGTRIQKQDESQDQSDPSAPRDVYIRYPTEKAGYATEESLPVQNTTQKNTAGSFANSRSIFPFFAGPKTFPEYSNPDPFRTVLNNPQQSQFEDMSKMVEKSNETQEGLSDQFASDIEFPFSQPLLPRPPSPLYADRSQRIPPFYPGPESARNPFNQMPVFPDRYPFPTSSQSSSESENQTPACAQQSNSSLCFEDQEYPKRELLYALSSDPFLTDRLAAPNQQLDGIDLVDQSVSESPDSQDNYICKSDIKKGMPLRAKNINGNWKIIVNIERGLGMGKFIQPVRLEVCREANEPCSFTTQVKTACVQKYSLQRLLSWSAEKGVHSDIFKLPVACSCQIVSTEA